MDNKSGLELNESKVSRDKLIARIQCFRDELVAWSTAIKNELAACQDEEDSEVMAVEINTLDTTLDLFEGLFEDIIVCRNDGRVY